MARCRNAIIVVQSAGRLSRPLSATLELIKPKGDPDAGRRCLKLPAFFESSVPGRFADAISGGPELGLGLEKLDD